MSEEDKSKEPTDQTQDDVKEPPSQDTGKQVPEKITLTQQELNNQLASARRESEKRLKDLQAEYNSYKQNIEAKEQAANDAAAEKVEALRKDLPEAITKLLDKLTPIEQLDWLNDPENAITKKQIPELPTSADGHGKQRKQINIV
jgi:molecular chaperone GrpE (heat shock protein)